MPFRLPKKKKKKTVKKRRGKKLEYSFFFLKGKIGVFKGAYSVYIISLVNVNELFLESFDTTTLM